MTKIRHSIIVLFALLTSFVYAQTEVEMQAQADKLFSNEQYLEATPLYLRLLSLQPRNTSYNFKYGTCLVFNNHQKSAAIPYLNFAITDPNINPEAYFFLGKALHLNYQFNEAIKNFNLYNEKKTAENKKLDAEHEIQMCLNGKRLMTTISDLIVVDKKEIQSDKFFRIYELNDIGGSLLVTAEFQTKIDKKYNHIPLIHFPQNPNVIYYSSYGNDESTGKDIYVRRRLPNGAWGEPQKLPGSVNTKYDDDFPYMHPDGNYLYFSSKGHNSMGGYDVFRSKYNPDNNDFGPPENMDFAISSPDDDLFYIVDSLNQNAYFASARQSQQGKLNVYKVKVDRVPIQLAVVKGNFISEINPENKRIDFQIQDYSNGEAIGKFNSNQKAVYLITFPKGGKYEYIMKIEGSEKEFRAIVSIPFLKEFKPLKQKIIHTTENGKEVVKIIDLFNEEVEDPQAVLAEVIKMRSDLNVNVNEFDMDELEKAKENEKILSELGFEGLNISEVSERLNDELKRIKEGQNEAQQIINNANASVVENSDLIKQYEEIIKVKVADANNAQSDEDKYRLLLEAQLYINKQNELKANSVKLLNLSDSISSVMSQAVALRQQDKVSQISSQFDALLKEGDKNKALNYLVENKQVLASTMNDHSIEFKQNIVNRIIEIDKDADKLNAKISEYQSEIRSLETTIQKLESDIIVAKKKDQALLQSQIDAKKEEVKMIRDELKKLDERLVLRLNEKALLLKQIESIESVSAGEQNQKVSKEMAIKAMDDVNKTNSKTLNNYVQSEVAALDKKDPTLKERIFIAASMNNDKIIEEYNKAKISIQNAENSNTKEKIQRQINNAQTTKRALIERFSSVEKELKSKPNDESLLKERAQLKNSINQIENDIVAYESELLIAEPIDVAALNSTFEEEKNTVFNNTSFNDAEKNKKVNELEKAQLEVLDNKIKSVENALKVNPTNEQLIQTKRDLTTNKTKVEASISQYEKDLALSKENENINTQIEDIKLQISKQKTQINQQNLSSNEKNQQLLTLLNSQNEKVKALLSKENSNSVKEQLNALNNELSSEIEVLEQKIASTNNLFNNNSNENIEVSKNIAEKLNQSLNEIKSSSALTEKEKNEQLKSLLNQTKLDVESAIEKAETNNDEKQIEALKSLKADIENQLLALNQEDVVENNSFSTNDLINELDKNYQAAIEKIENNTKFSSEEKKAEKINLDKALLSKINEAISIIDEQLKTDIQNKELLNKKSNLEDLKSIVEERVGEYQQTLENNVVGNLTSEEKLLAKNEIISEIDKKYLNLKAELLKASSPNYSELIQANNDLLSKIQLEISSIEKQLAKNPTDNDLTKRKALLKEIELDAKAEINNWENAQSLVLTPEKIEKEIKAIIAESSPKLNIDEIDAKSIGKLTNEDVVEKNTLLNDFATDVDAMIVALENQIKENDANQKLKNDLVVYQKLQELLSSKKVLLKNEIEKRNIDINSNQISEQLLVSKMNELSPDREEKNLQIEQNTALSEIEKLKAKNENDAQLIEVAIDKNLEISNFLEQNPLDEKLQKESQLLDQVIANLEKSIEERKVQISKIENAIVENNPKVLNKDELIESLVPGLQSNIEAITADESIDSNTKEAMLRQLNEALLQKAQLRLADLNEKLIDNPNSADLIQEINKLNEIIANTEKLLNQEANQLVSKEEKLKLMSELQADQILDASLNLKSIDDVNVAIKSIEKSELILAKEIENTEKLLLKSNTAELQRKKMVLESLMQDVKLKKDEILQAKKDIEMLNKQNNLLSVVDKNYQKDIASINSMEDEVQKQNALVEREKLHVEAIENKIDENRIKNEQKPNENLAKENEILAKALLESQQKIEALSKNRVDVNETSQIGNDFMTNFKNEQLGSKQNVLDATFTDKVDQEQQLQVLRKYESAITSKLNELEQKLVNDKENTKLINEKESLTEELVKVKNKIRSVEISIGELVEVKNNDDQNELTSETLTKLNDEKNGLLKQLVNADEKDQKDIQKSLSKVEIDIVAEENDLITSNNQKEEQIINEQLKSLPSSNKTKEVIENSLTENTQLQEQVDQSKNEKEKQYLLQQISDNQKKIINTLNQEQIDLAIQSFENENGIQNIESKSELEQKKRNYTIEIGELTQRINQLKSEQADVKEKEKVAITEQIKVLEQRKAVLQEKIKAIDQKIGSIETNQISEVYDEKSENVSISQVEEEEIASKESYQNYVKQMNDAIEIKIAIQEKNNEINNLKAAVLNLIQEQASENNNDKQTEIKDKANQLKILERELVNLQEQYAVELQEAKNILPSNEEEAMKMENLMRRAVAPINKVALAVTLAAIPEAGLSIEANGVSTYNETNRIPINVKASTGLVYRVQIGAFAKPIEQDRFKEFNPVSGETTQTGLTRYMAGYFNSSARVMTALAQVKALGYQDAFPVAYCDGKRINLAEARRMEATGECVPKTNNELMIEMAVNTSSAMNLEDTTKLRKKEQFNYNKAPGAAKADAVESKNGLFFTVQVGVYNQPVPAATLNNIEPLVTLKLANGQIRYSSGIFHSVDEARPKKKEAIDKGIKDAFITAYYKGNRISIDEALIVLNEKGPKVLEPKTEVQVDTLTTNPKNNSNTIVNPIVVTKVVPLKYYQIVSKASYDEFPVEILNRYNSHGSFYFDENDHKVKSMIVSDEYSLPQYHYFKDDVEKKIYSEEEIKLDSLFVSINFDNISLPGDFMDWLMRKNYRKSYHLTENGVEVKIFVGNEEQQKIIESEMEKLGFK